MLVEALGRTARKMDAQIRGVQGDGQDRGMLIKARLARPNVRLAGPDSPRVEMPGNMANLFAGGCGQTAMFWHINMLCSGVTGSARLDTYRCNGERQSSASRCLILWPVSRWFVARGNYLLLT